jgi:DNA-binding response OmpR family regulator
LAQARHIIEETPPRAIILDILLPDGRGLDLLQELRKFSSVPVLILTGMGNAKDVVAGLDAGGDDYLVKPFDSDIFAMRLQALLRRADLVPDILELEPLRLEVLSGRAYVNDVDLELQQKEFSLLLQFMRAPEQFLAPTMLYQKVWGQKMLGRDQAVKVAVSKLRKKLEGSGYTIVASRGEGYAFERE